MDLIIWVGLQGLCIKSRNMEEKLRELIEKWYGEKIHKTPEEFDPYDKHITRVIIEWEKERNLYVGENR